MVAAESCLAGTARSSAAAVGVTVSSDPPLYPSHTCPAADLQAGVQVWLPLLTPDKTFPVHSWEDGTLTVSVGGDLWEVPMAAGTAVEVYDRGGGRYGQTL